MIASLINIRFKQFYREILRIGLFRIIVLLGLCSMFFIFLYAQAGRFPNVLYACIIVLVLILMLHTKRGDKLFVRINFSNYKWIFFVEYTLITLVFLVFILIHNYWYLALPFVFILGIIVQLDFKGNQISYNTRVQKWIPDECFEWKSGIRNLFILTLCTWIAGFIFSFFVASVPFAMVVLGIITLSFLEKGEPYQMIIAHEKGPNKFFLLKIKQQVALLSILFAPLILAFLVFHYELWYIPFVILLMFCILQIYTTFIKYSFYEPNSNSPAAQMFIGVGVVGFMVPILVPLVILLTVRFYFKAKKNLNFYLNDYD